MKKKRLLFQLYPSYLFITLISLLAVSWYASTTFREFFLDKTAADLKVRAFFLESKIKPWLISGKADQINTVCNELGLRTATRITVVLPSGRVVADSDQLPSSMDNHGNRPEVIAALDNKTGRKVRFSNTLKQKMMYVAIPLKSPNGVSGVLRAAIPLTSIDDALENIYKKVFAGGLAIALLAALLSFWVSRRISLPLEKMKEGAEHFAEGKLGHKLSVPDSLEFGALAESLNKMAIQLDDRINTVLRQRNEQEAMLSSMVEGVLAVDKEERILHLNNAAAVLIESSPDQAKGRNVYEVVKDSSFKRFIAEILESSMALKKDIRVFDTSERILQVQGTNLCDLKGEIIGALIVINDLTRLRKLENVRSEFVANVSHELKTPITSIKGYVETLLEGAMHDNRDLEKFLKIILRQSNRLNAIIEDLLTLSRIEQNKEDSRLVFEPTNIRSVIEAALSLCESSAAEKEIRLSIDCRDDIKANINPPLLEQAFVNLLDNAIKYSTAQSSVEIEVSEMEAELAVAVKDHGPGIEKKHLGRLFERFYRTDKARSRKMGGTGLGLAIVKHIVQTHKGRVDVTSLPDKGSTFYVYLPLA